MRPSPSKIPTHPQPPKPDIGGCDCPAASRHSGTPGRPHARMRPPARPNGNRLWAEAPVPVPTLSFSLRVDRVYGPPNGPVVSNAASAPKGRLSLHGAPTLCLFGGKLHVCGEAHLLDPTDGAPRQVKLSLTEAVARAEYSNSWLLLLCPPRTRGSRREHCFTRVIPCAILCRAPNVRCRVDQKCDVVQEREACHAPAQPRQSAKSVDQQKV